METKRKKKKKEKRRGEERIVWKKKKKLVPYLVHFIAILFVFSKEENVEEGDAALLALAKLIRGVKTHARLTLHVALITRSYNPIDRQFTAVAPVNGKF